MSLHHLRQFTQTCTQTQEICTKVQFERTRCGYLLRHREQNRIGLPSLPHFGIGKFRCILLYMLMIKSLEKRTYNKDFCLTVGQLDRQKVILLDLKPLKKHNKYMSQLKGYSNKDFNYNNLVTPATITRYDHEIHCLLNHFYKQPIFLINDVYSWNEHNLSQLDEIENIIINNIYKEVGKISYHDFRVSQISCICDQNFVFWVHNAFFNYLHRFCTEESVKSTFYHLGLGFRHIISKQTNLL